MKDVLSRSWNQWRRKRWAFFLMRIMDTKHLLEPFCLNFIRGVKFQGYCSVFLSCFSTFMLLDKFSMELKVFFCIFLVIWTTKLCKRHSANLGYDLGNDGEINLALRSLYAQNLNNKITIRWYDWYCALW